MFQTDELQTEIAQSLLGKPCWYASFGGCAGSTFQLAFGAKIARRVPGRNEKHTEEFRKYEGEANLLVWCSWRLDDAAGPIASSDDTDEHIAVGLNRLLGTSPATLSCGAPGWDLRIGFANGLTLRVFCDHVPGDPSFSSNWELWEKDRVIAIDAGSVVSIEPRDT